MDLKTSRLGLVSVPLLTAFPSPTSAGSSMVVVVVTVVVWLVGVCLEMEESLGETEGGLLVVGGA